MATKVTITMEIDDDYADPEHWMGVTNEGFELLFRALSPYGDDIDINRSA